MRRSADITRLALEVHADALLCAGDLFEQARYSPDTVAFLEQTFDEIDPLPVFLAPGNHDWYAPDSPYRQARWSPNVHVFTEDRLEPVRLDDGLTLWGAATGPRPGRSGSWTASRSIGRACTWGWSTPPSAAASRPGEAGLQPHAPFEAAQIERAGLHHLLVGHYHRPRDADRYTYPGNPDFLVFGEDGERGAVIADRPAGWQRRAGAPAGGRDGGPRSDPATSATAPASRTSATG